MPSSFQIKTRPEIQAQMFNTIRAQEGVSEDDLVIGSLIRTFVEAVSLQNADEYIQIGKLVSLYARSKAKGEDLDRRALDFGADVFRDMRRREALTSTVGLAIGDGTTRRFARFTADVLATVVTFTIDNATSWPTSGSAVLERGTLREESIVFTRVGTTITVVSPATGLVNPHVENGPIETTGVKSILALPVAVAAGSATIASGTESAWPSSGAVIFERDTVRRELRTFTRVGTVLTLNAVTTFAHAASTQVVLSTFGSDRPISAGSSALVPASTASVQILFRTKDAGTLFDGDYVTATISAESDAPGDQTRVGSNTIVQWQQEPFAGATVTNPNAATRGRNREQDDAYNARISAFIQSLSRATALAIETLTAGQQDSFSGLFIAFAQTVEPVAPGESLLYVSDGSSTFAPDTAIFFGRDVLIADARVNDKRARLNNYGPFSKLASPAASRTPRLFKSYERGSATSVGVNYIEDTSKAWTVNEHAGRVVKTDDNQFYTVASNTALRLTLNAGGATPSFGSYSLINFALDPLIPDTDYVFNMSNGDLELVTPLVLHDSLVAASDGASLSVGAYTYSRGVVAHAQRLVNGDRKALDDFPGIKALGTHCRVVVPTIVTPTIVIQVVTASGLADSDLAGTVKSVIQAYVNGLGIRENVLLSEIGRLVKALPGVTDCKVIAPSANFTVSDGQIARVNASDIQVV